MKCLLCGGPLISPPSIERRFCIRCGVYMEDIPTSVLEAKIAAIDLEVHRLLYPLLFGDH